MFDDYIYIGSIAKKIKLQKAEIERLILDGDNGEVNGYLKKAVAEIEHALADLKNATFEAITSSEIKESIREQENKGTGSASRHQKEADQKASSALVEVALVNDPYEAKLFFDEFDIPYREITRGENKGKLKVKSIRDIDWDNRMEAERKLRRFHLGIVIDHPNIFRDKDDNTVVTFSPYEISDLPKDRPWLEMSDHSIYGNGTKTFVVRFISESNRRC